MKAFGIFLAGALLAIAGLTKPWADKTSVNVQKD